LNSFSQDTNSIEAEKKTIRIDLLVDCIRNTSNPQVQNAALLLISCLAAWVPDIVLHNVMPIFTFMGTTILRQGDEYSAHVIDQVGNRL
jgi:U3 small nucleolar RNA-associated protein 10